MPALRKASATATNNGAFRFDPAPCVRSKNLMNGKLRGGANEKGRLRWAARSSIALKIV